MIKISALSKTYTLGQTLVTALENLDCTITAGEFVALAGSSGSGKSTLLNLLGGFDLPTSGRLEIAGQDLAQMDDAGLSLFRAQQLGFIFQTFNLLPVLSALENVEFPLVRQGIPAEQARARATASLTRVGLADQLHHRPDQLSGGQRQRVAIARAMVHEPKIILADEPTANLDKVTAKQILTLLSELNRELGLTVLVATHDPMVIGMAGRVMHLSSGRLESDAALDIKANVKPLYLIS